jgi:hypothetical protein
MDLRLDILTSYRQVAGAWADAYRGGRTKQSQLLQVELDRVDAELRRLGEHDRLAVLCNEGDVSVALCAATHRLRAGDHTAIPVLRRIAAGPPGIIRLTAERTLLMLTSGAAPV